jgi:hypothetical protein
MSNRLPFPSAVYVSSMGHVWNVSTLSWDRWDGSVSIGDGPSTATVSSVSASATNVTLLTANTSRVFASVFNDSDKAMYIKLGTTATTSSFTVKLFPNGVYEVPFPAYTGQVDALWDAAPTGAARVTEG